MQQPLLKAIATLCAKSAVLTALIGGVIALVGYFNKWTSPIAYSNAFFLAGSLMIIAGASSRFAASQGGGAYQLLGAESFRNMSSGERRDHIIKVSSSLSTVILGLITGAVLLVISAIAAKMP